ncbi:Uma2 family endonuclease [Gloeocapsa sp. PCC 73106]|uniref:Uma2 family endonuclease n=1 Tax=Gloeocapsa sp. PCC 73106 TaxID=102232 RepID=UPI0002ACFC9F|nr:Uma2 family endonuclease [Gloeocapsa sp. PCC 73106]ELR96553.1 hypothetical protein GLO73106DRAFT_00003480 [Gloeocapsa sp. PCC 73106]
MLKNYNLRQCLPSAEDLPDSDDIPVDNELQDLIPSLLKASLALIWSERLDWFFGIDMGIYYDPEKPPIVADAFVSLKVPRIIDQDLRYSYVLWEEQQVPLLTIEVVSQQRRGEYSVKKALYAQIGVLYYVVYNPQRRRKSSLEVYQLIGGEYQRLTGQPIRLAAIEIGIGVEIGTYQGITREWLYWYDAQGSRYLTPEERIQQEQQKAARLAAKLKSLGIDPDSI